MKTLSMNVARFALGLGLVLAAVASPAYAAPGVPEIGAGEAVSALTLLSGGYLILSSRFRGK